MAEVDARLNRGELQALLAAIDCFTDYPKNALWWKGKPHDRATFEGLRLRFEEELKLLGD